jgi:hypothetical protein
MCAMGVAACWAQERGLGHVMSSRLHALGFPAVWTAHSAKVFDRLLRDGNCRDVNSGSNRYAVWRTTAGAEVWFRMTPPDETAADTAPNGRNGLAAVDEIIPFHTGTSRVSLLIDDWLDGDSEDPSMCLAHFCGADGDDNEPALLLATAPTVRLTGPYELPITVVGQVVCFAQKLWAYPTDESYAAATPANRRMAVGSVLEVAPRDVPEVPMDFVQSALTLGLASGRVLRAIRHHNPLTDAPYYWVELGTDHGPLDIVANPGSIEGDISIGHVVQVCGSFVARILEEM